LLSQILGFVDGFFREQNEYGGVQVDFVHQLDDLARTYFAATATADASESTRLARERFLRSTGGKSNQSQSPAPIRQAAKEKYKPKPTVLEPVPPGLN